MYNLILIHAVSYISTELNQKLSFIDDTMLIFILASYDNVCKAH